MVRDGGMVVAGHFGSEEVGLCSCPARPFAGTELAAFDRGDSGGRRSAGGERGEVVDCELACAGADEGRVDESEGAEEGVVEGVEGDAGGRSL